MPENDPEHEYTDQSEEFDVLHVPGPGGKRQPAAAVGIWILTLRDWS